MTERPESVARALGLHHTLATALADLIDNSIDARARHVLVRFMQNGMRVTALRVIDDGCGMGDPEVDAAVRYGVGRDHESSDQGHFGVGLKAASLSQADGLAIYSRAAEHDAVGRLLTVTGRSDAPQSEALTTVDSHREFDAACPRFPMETGTIIEWRGIRTFPVSASPDDQGLWLETTIGDLQSWLGLVFHRLIDRGLQITIDAFDTLASRAGAPRSVRAINPFGYRRSGHASYPQSLTVAVEDSTSVIAHVWPARSTLPEYKLGGLPGRDAQGFFVYRNDRLLQAGGWLGILRPRPEWALARVEVDLNPVLAEHITLNPEKSGVRIDATLSAALRTALTNGYLDAAADTMVSARRVQRRPIAVVEPGGGLPDEVADEFADSFSFAPTVDPVDIGWRVLPHGRFFEVDLDNRALWLNARLRGRLGGRRRSEADVPLIRTLLYLLTQDMFDAVRHSSRQVEQMEAWQRVLIAALAAEEEGDR